MVASREFTDERGQTVTLVVGKPDPDPAPGGSWRCPVRFSGPSDDGRVQYIYGVDSLQALILALGIAKVMATVVVTTHGPLRWNGELDLGLDYEMTTWASNRPDPDAKTSYGTWPGVVLTIGR